MYVTLSVEKSVLLNSVLSGGYNYLLRQWIIYTLPLFKLEAVENVIFGGLQTKVMNMTLNDRKLYVGTGGTLCSLREACMIIFKTVCCLLRNNICKYRYL